MTDATKIIIAQRITSVMDTDQIIILMTVESMVRALTGSCWKRILFIRKFMLPR